ncbi:hypothetical protein [Lysobacter sp. CA199]|uniref:hypothetical protein n=1 Tax=Lysobacter sp. CA199 TaxID=3455608 RepID=UPI003F8CF5B5
MTISSNQVSTGVSVVALIVSFVALGISVLQYRSDYSETVVVQPGALPVRLIKLGKTELDLEVQNTSRSNLRYFIRVESNMGFIHGPVERTRSVATGYQSQVISLMRSDLPKSSFTHRLVLDAGTVGPTVRPLAIFSDPEFFLSVEVLNASTGKVLFESTCYYMFHTEYKTFQLEQPAVDTTGEADRRQIACNP